MSADAVSSLLPGCSIADNQRIVAVPPNRVKTEQDRQMRGKGANQRASSQCWSGRNGGSSELQNSKSVEIVLDGAKPR